MAKISRRDILQFIGAGGLGTGAGYLYAEVIKRPVELLIPPVVPPEDYSPGVATWYNTVCNQCSAGCGISVRIREGRAKKIEGNPVHPVNQGRLCPRGQAGLNVLYNPDRIRGPLKRAGERGDGNYEPISWDEALTSLSGLLGRLKIENRAEGVQLVTGRTRGHLDELFDRFMTLLGSGKYLQYDFTAPINLTLANQRSFGSGDLPYYDIRNADYLLSFGADYLGTWISPVHHSLAYGHLRQGRSDRRGRCVQVEPRMSLSGASADEWIAATPGSEGMLALGIGRLLVAEGRYDGADRNEWEQVLESFTAERVAAATGIEPDRIVRLAADFGGSEASLAIAGGATAAGTNAVSSLMAVNALNHLVGNLGKPGGVIFNPPPPFGSGQRQAGLSQVLELAETMNSGDIDVLLINDFNPVYALPQARFRNALNNVPMVVAMSSFMDETTALADLILPTDTYLEAWGDDYPDPGVGFPVASISQPVVARVFDTRSVGDIILSLGRQIGGELPINLPWADTEEFIQSAWRDEFESMNPEPDGASFTEFWMAALQAGIWGRPEAAASGPAATPAASAVAAFDAAAGSFAGDESEYPFVLHPFLTHTFLDGRGANLPWLQELPDPMTSVVYGSWVELNPDTARQLGVTEGDVVEIESPAGIVRAPVFIFQAIAPGVVAMPMGQGHTEYGRYAQGRGVNPIQIVAMQTDAQSGELAWAATRVKLTRTGERERIVKNDGVTRTLGRPILHPADDHA